MHVFGVRAHLLEGEAVKGVGDHREVLAEVAIGPGVSARLATNAGSR